VFFAYLALFHLSLAQPLVLHLACLFLPSPYPPPTLLPPLAQHTFSHTFILSPSFSLSFSLSPFLSLAFSLYHPFPLAFPFLPHTHARSNSLSSHSVTKALLLPCTMWSHALISNPRGGRAKKFNRSTLLLWRRERYPATRIKRADHERVIGNLSRHRIPPHLRVR
jgi:hypothetical protein